MYVQYVHSKSLLLHPPDQHAKGSRDLQTSQPKEKKNRKKKTLHVHHRRLPPSPHKGAHKEGDQKRKKGALKQQIHVKDLIPYRNNSTATENP